jgi:4-diphosphocytidyl-2-C-methyl-D-erythritol kinase
MKTIRFKTPAKINLGLNIIGKRPDGFHNIETFFYPIKLFDYLTISISRTFKFNSNIEFLNSDSNNSIIKAKKVLENLIGGKLNFHVELEKNIPIGAGMGGGSSDGAAILLALNRLFELNLAKQKLGELALKIGSDVPYFIDPKPCFAISRGEVIQKLKYNIPFPILIVNPGIHISTKWAYENISPNKPRYHLFNLPLIQPNKFEELKQLVNNDFEEVVFKKYSEIQRIKDSLYNSEAIFALMTGSGSTVFGIFKNIELAQKAEAKFMKRYFTFINKP